MKLILAFILIFPGLPWAQTEDPNKRPAFKKTSATIGKKKILVEVADTEEKRAYGLMFVKKLSSDEGMLFIFERPQMLSFWMKNTLIPLDIGYFDSEKRLIEVIPMQPESLVARTLPSYPSSKPAQYALEMTLGWFKKNNIAPGAILKFTP